MKRSFICTLELDPSADPQIIAKELFDSIAYDFPELVSVAPWAEHDAPTGPRPIEGEILMGGTPL